MNKYEQLYNDNHILIKFNCAIIGIFIIVASIVIIIVSIELVREISKLDKDREEGLSNTLLNVVGISLLINLFLIYLYWLLSRFII